MSETRKKLSEINSAAWEIRWHMFIIRCHNNHYRNYTPSRKRFQKKRNSNGSKLEEPEIAGIGSRIFKIRL
ncbi:hypothetical protein NQ317_009303, partial [Molorchus minor]